MPEENYEKRKSYTADEYFHYMLTNYLFTQSDSEKQMCREELKKLAEKYNGIKRRYTYELYLTKKI